jgi:hypothetical protein
VNGVERLRRYLTVSTLSKQEGVPHLVFLVVCQDISGIAYELGVRRLQLYWTSQWVVRSIVGYNEYGLNSWKETNVHADNNRVFLRWQTLLLSFVIDYRYDIFSCVKFAHVQTYAFVLLLDWIRLHCS